MITKYDWFKAVYAERRFSAGERSVLGYIAIVYIRDGTAFCVRQSVIAQRCDVSEMLAGRGFERRSGEGIHFPAVPASAAQAATAPTN